MTAEKGSSKKAGEAREVARAIIKHHFGSVPRRVVQRAGGLTNFVFEVNHVEGDFIVRLSRDPAKIKDYLKEQWAIARAREAGVPTPEVLEVGCEVASYPYMVARRVAGRNATHHPERLKVLREMGHYMALIHSIPTSGFGQTFDWSNNQLSRNGSWKEYLRSELKVDERVALLESERMISKQQLRMLRSTLRKLERLRAAPVLNHGDIRLKNVMVNKAGVIAAIIDWEDCTSNIAPHWDASLALHDLSIDAKQILLAGYGLGEEEIREMAPCWKTLNLLNYVPEIERLLEAKAMKQLEQYRTRLNGTLDLFSL